MIRDIDALKELMGLQDPELIQKALSVGTGFVGINLEATAKLMLPLFAGLRNRIYTDTPKQGGTQAIWRMQLGYGGFDFAGNMGTAFEGVGGDAAGSALTIQADYKTQAVKGQVGYEAIPMARGFDDPLQIETSRTLATELRLEELLILMGNTAALAAPTALTGTTGSPGTTFGAGVWMVVVTALTGQGYISNLAGASNVGESVASVGAAITTTSGNGQYLSVYWAPVPGAVGYKVYCNAVVGGGSASSALFCCDPATKLAYKDGTAITPAATGSLSVGITNCRIIAVPGGSANPPAADGTANALAFEGLTSWAEKSTIYGQAIGTKIFNNQNGSKLTTAGSGITEFDAVLRNLWSNWVISPSLIITSPLGASHLTDQLVAANNAAMYRLEISAERGGFIGGVFVGGYVNKFAASLANQQVTVPVWAHPYLPDGTFLFLTEKVPYQYSREARGFALDVQTPYTYFELARTTRVFPFSIFFTEVLKCYHPLAQAAIVGARVEA
jgi:hypothetical protein